MRLPDWLEDALPQWPVILLFTLLLVLFVGLGREVWSECRTEGHSVPYCLSLVSR